MHFYGTTDLSLGKIVMNLIGGIRIRFDRDEAANTNVKMDSINVTGATSHAVETWNIDGLTINEVIARDVGECGLLLQMTTNAKVGLVDADNAGAGTGYAALRFANQNGKLNGGYETNIYVDKVVAKKGGRGFFCVSESRGAEIGIVDISDTEIYVILIENCYGVTVLGGTVWRWRGLPLGATSSRLPMTLSSILKSTAPLSASLLAVPISISCLTSRAAPR
ncbi:hypothetical protein VC83_01002 [Pseudogymnoascus destructans]|uniref:Pectate lyase superfamily protein domain-containing protein n=2 Tax=Pseudogymnoascus destructans TaxID=655981 RepID=L8FPY9_PSED2|nr:uncharacterized protein VC83_01002 [Pseudogymnoascus destructans]ELR01771.1 hypothetical protein GMDG_00147 [Pseudogymnoascus destructans 20631-21]OAF62504.1 hypothetical protein VC83_01002 [Pseudogymnoascus destructans]